MMATKERQIKEHKQKGEMMLFNVIDVFYGLTIDHRKLFPGSGVFSTLSIDMKIESFTTSATQTWLTLRKLNSIIKFQS